MVLVVKILILFIIGLILTYQVNAHGKHDDIKFDSALNTGVDALVEEVNKDLMRAKQPGFSYLYDSAHDSLEGKVSLENGDAKALLTWARVLQHEHRFDVAKKYLNKSVLLDNKNINAFLLLARVHLATREYQLAKRACLNLVGLSDVVTSSICLLEAASYDGALDSSYKQLQRIVAQQALSDVQSQWAALVLADMAYRLFLAAESEMWLDKHFTKDDTHYLIEWADIKIELGKAQLVLDVLAPIVKKLKHTEDGLLLRLALAEKRFGQEKYWQLTADKRFAHLEDRQDVHHAGDMARYYLYVSANTERALYWAELNWQQVQEPKDRVLLERAQREYKRTD